MSTAKTKPTRAMEDTITETQETVERAFKAGQEAAARGLEQAMSATREQIDRNSQTFFKGFDEFTVYGKENLDAMLAAGAIVAKGWEDLGRAWFAYAQGNVEEGVNAAKAVMTAKSIREAVDLQSSFAKTTFDGFLAESAKLSELSMKVANEAFAPISARVGVAVEKFSKPVAA